MNLRKLAAIMLCPLSYSLHAMKDPDQTTYNKGLTQKLLHQTVSLFEKHINSQDAQGSTALHNAISARMHPVIIAAILRNTSSKATLDLQNQKGDTALHECFYLSNLDSDEEVRDYISVTVAQLFVAGANPDIKNKKEISPRELAIKNGFHACFNEMMSTCLVNALSLSSIS